MTQQRKFQGVWIPADLWLDRTMSITEKVMLAEIDSLEDKERGCYASNAYFAEFFGLSISRVSEIISSLAAKKLVDVQLIRDGKRIVERQIRLLPPPFGKPNTPSENTANPFGKGDEPPSEKAKGNSTSKNNTDEGSKRLRGTDDPEFELAWSLYPKRAGGNSKADALKAWRARRAAGVDANRMIDGARRYAEFCRATNRIGTEYVKQTATFFGPSLHFDDDWTPPDDSGRGPRNPAPAPSQSHHEQGAGDARPTVEYI
ncbi:helix-turn-helix domain-containing protein [Burkholderia mayonis]|uniref:helix-turn-helix domain-containing protein n=1 Tax=Burkholderia mayonis TaxID=1385591 RepID=UPI0019399AB7|nr:helix-turn-helix domain-containing protein [Burkholderia mayonis]